MHWRKAFGFVAVTNILQFFGIIILVFYSDVFCVDECGTFPPLGTLIPLGLFGLDLLVNGIVFGNTFFKIETKYWWKILGWLFLLVFMILSYNLRFEGDSIAFIREKNIYLFSSLFFGLMLILIANNDLALQLELGPEQSQFSEKTTEVIKNSLLSLAGLNIVFSLSVGASEISLVPDFVLVIRNLMLFVKVLLPLPSAVVFWLYSRI